MSIYSPFDGPFSSHILPPSLETLKEREREEEREREREEEREREREKLDNETEADDSCVSWTAILIMRQPLEAAQ